MSSSSSSSSSSTNRPQNILSFNFPQELTPTCKTLLLGTRPFLAGFHHWAVKVGEYWIEIGGESKKAALEQQQLFVHTKDSNYTKLYTVHRRITATYSQVKNWCRQWLRDHPQYEPNDDNCQMFVKDLLKTFAQVEVQTENSSVGGAMIGGGLLAIAFGAIATVVGAIIKGGH